MASLRPTLALALTLAIVPLAAAQATDPPVAASVAPSRLLAGLRDYSDDTVTAIFRVAGCPALLDELAAHPERIDRPDAVATPLQPSVREALRALAATPPLLQLLVEQRRDTAALGRLATDAPEGTLLRLEELRRLYARAERDAAAEWERLLRNDPIALGQYRALLTRLCREQRASSPNFAVVQVMDRRYYYACPPADFVMGFAAQNAPPQLARLIERFVQRFGADALDARVLKRSVAAAPDSGVASPDAPPLVIEIPIDARREMFKDVALPDVQAVGLIPVVMQPPADQPPGARLAVAIMEQERLWTEPPVAVARAPQQPAAAGPDQGAAPAARDTAAADAAQNGATAPADNHVTLTGDFVDSWGWNGGGGGWWVGGYPFAVAWGGWPCYGWNSCVTPCWNPCWNPCNGPLYQRGWNGSGGWGSAGAWGTAGTWPSSPCGPVGINGWQGGVAATSTLTPGGWPWPGTPCFDPLPPGQQVWSYGNGGLGAGRGYCDNTGISGQRYYPSAVQQLNAPVRVPGVAGAAYGGISARPTPGMYGAPQQVHSPRTGVTPMPAARSVAPISGVRRAPAPAVRPAPAPAPISAPRGGGGRR